MKNSAFSASLALACAFAIPAHAQQEERIKTELKKNAPEATVESVRKITYGANLYEVIVGGDIYYTDDTARSSSAPNSSTSRRNHDRAAHAAGERGEVEWLPWTTRSRSRAATARARSPLKDRTGYRKRFERSPRGHRHTGTCFLYPILATDSVEASRVVQL